MKKIKVEVVEIYPYEDRGKFLERGSVHVFIENFSLDLKNIPYFIKEEKREGQPIYHAHISLPYRLYKQPQDDGSVKSISVPTVSFRNKIIWKLIKKAVQEEILKEFDPSTISLLDEALVTS